MHALTGCDTVPNLFGIGKKKGINALVKNNLLLFSLGHIESSLDDVFAEASMLIGVCYGVKIQCDMSTIRYNIWRKRTEWGKLSSSPKLCAPPPTSEVSHQNVLRAHYQSIVWAHRLSPGAPELGPCTFGRYKDETNKFLVSVMIPGHNTVPQKVRKCAQMCVCVTLFN